MESQQAVGGPGRHRGKKNNFVCRIVLVERSALSQQDGPLPQWVPSGFLPPIQRRAAEVRLIGDYILHMDGWMDFFSDESLVSNMQVELYCYPYSVNINVKFTLRKYSICNS